MPRRGLIEVRLRPSAHPRALTALWLIGLETDPLESGQVCVVELFGHDLDMAGSGCVGAGIHPFGDSRLRHDHALVPVSRNLTDWHIHTVEVDDNRTRFFVDGELFTESPQAPERQQR